MLENSPLKKCVLGSIITAILLLGAFLFPSKTYALGCNIPVGSGANQIEVSGTKVFVSVGGGTKLAVFDSDSNLITDFIEISETPRFLKRVGSKLYVGTAANVVKVINVNTNAISSTVPVGDSSNHAAVFDNKLYVANLSSDSVSVINFNDTVIATIPVVAPEKMILVGTKVYVLSGSSDTVTVIDAGTDTVASTISVGNQPDSAHLIGTKLYIINNLSDDVSVIETSTDTVDTTISVGTNPVSGTVIGTKLYVSNSGSGDVSVIDSDTDSVVATVTVGAGINTSYEYGTDLYLTSTADDTVYVYNTLDDTVTTSFATGGGAGSSIYVAAVGNKLFVPRPGGADVAVVNMDTNTVIDACATKVATPAVPWSIVPLGTKVYINTLGDKITVFDNDAKLVTGNITVGSLPYSGVLYASKYFAINSTSQSVSVINTGNNAIVATINGIGSGANYGGTAGDKVLTVNSNDNSVTVINGDTNSIVTTLSVGPGPTRMVAVGNKAYVFNSGGNTVSVINTVSNTVTATITVGSEPVNAVLSGTELYVINHGGDTVSVINTLTDTVARTITGFSGPNSGYLYRSKIFIVNDGDDSVAVIATGGGAITDSFSAGSHPVFPIVVGDLLFVVNNLEDNMYVYDPNTYKHFSTIPLSSRSSMTSQVNGTLYVSGTINNEFSHFNYAALGYPDLVAPLLSEYTPVTTPTSDTTPSYTFQTSESGTIQYGGSCSSVTTAAVEGVNMVTFNTLASGTYSNCTISLIDGASNVSNVLSVTPFTIEAAPDSTPGPTTPSTAGLRTGSGEISGERIVDGRVTHGALPAVVRPTIQSVNPLVNGNSNSKTPFLQDLNIGQSHSDVKRLQIYLNGLGLIVAKAGAGSPGKETNYYGPATKAAVLRYQKTHGIRPATGFFGPITREIINRK